ncbi:hypothetical protein BBO99_00009485, partial [Phytophthora kernoviae]
SKCLCDVVYATPMMAGAGSFGEYLDIDAKQTSYQALITHGKLLAGQRVLILGGSNATGLFGIQITKALGAEVITMASARNVELVKSVGADQRHPRTTSTMINIPPTFKAFEYANFGDVLKVMKLNLQMVQKPLTSDEVRVRVISAAVNPLDYKLVAMGATMLPTAPTDENPFRMGFDMAGIVVEIGSGDVYGLKVGDAVFATPVLTEGGCFGEYLNASANVVAPKPSNMTFNEAAGVPIAGVTSYQALITHGKLQVGQRVLILGGSSATGMFGIQIAKALGAEVITTASTRNVELVKSLGADQVIEYTTQKWGDILADHSVDLIYDCGMEPESWASNAQKILKLQSGIFASLSTGRRVEPVESSIGAAFSLVHAIPSGECLREIAKLIEAGHVKTVIDSVYSLEKLADAIKLQQSNKARGKIIIEVAKE